MRHAVLLVFLCAAVASRPERVVAGDDAPQTTDPGSSQVTLEVLDDRVRVLLGGEPLAEYVFRGYSRPIVYPIVGPHGLGMTRNWPMRDDVAGESHDHPHQKAMFVGFGSVNGVNFFAESPEAGRIVHRELLGIGSDAARGWLKAANDWVARDGSVICSDTRRIAFQAVPGGRAIDWELTLHASQGDVTFADDKHGLLAIRMHPNLQLDNDPAAGVTTANGQVINSQGVRGATVFGQRADWIDYWGSIDGHTVGVAIFDHPANPRHPTWWMARGYGYCAADPFGAHAIGGEPPGTGDMTLPAGQSVTFRYRFVFHAGDPDQARVRDQYREYAEAD
ncbi:MAG: PmoA family protein [Pirellulaceae bacterium]|jgi:hypothetical protein|nr:PmoA family protein [Pirellulaceae bacterium]